MKINAFDISQYSNRKNHAVLFHFSYYSNLTPLSQDMVSFKGNKNSVKKSHFKGIDFATVEKYRVDISKFKSTDDLQDWANDRIKTITENDFGGRQEETKVQRKAMLKEWINYVTKENDAYTSVMQLAILDAMTKDLKPNTDTIPPVLNKGVLADTMTEVVDRLNKNPKDNININKLYQTKLAAASAPTDSEGKAQTDFTGWVVVPSKIHDAENFEANVDKLKALSHDTWCTKSFHAELYLSDGDFHVYLENGKPKLGVRFIGDEIEEVQGEFNNDKIPQTYFETAIQYIKQNKFKLNSKAETEIKTAKKAKVEIEKVLGRLGEDAVKESKIEVILPYYGINVKKDIDGKFIIYKFFQPSNLYTFEDLGVDENKLLKNVKEVSINMCLIDSKATNLENLERVCGILHCEGRSDLNLKNLKYVSSAHFENTKNINLESLEEVGEKADFSYAENLNLTSLKRSGYTDFTSAKIKNLDSLEECNALILTDSDIESMNNLEIVSSSLFLNKKIKTLPKLRVVTGHLENLNNDSELEDMPNLELIGHNIKINCPNLKKLNSLKYIGGSLSVQEDAGIEELNNLEEVGGNVELVSTKIKSLPKLKKMAIL